MTTPMRISNELRVGIMFLTGLILLVLIIVTLTRWGQDRNTYSITMRFKQAQGILEGAAVRVAGVQVGRVTTVDFDSATSEAIVIARINHKVQLYANYVYTIGIGGLVGERFVEIRPVEHNRGGLLFDGSSVDGKTTPDINDLFENTSKLVSKLSGTADSLNEVIASPENRRNLRMTLANLNKTSQNAVDFSGSLNQLVRRDSPSIDEIVANLRGTSEDIHTISASLTPQLANTNLIHNLEEASENVKYAAGRIQGLTDQICNTLDDKEMASIRETLRNINKASADIAYATGQARLASAALPRTMGNIEHASGSVNRAMSSVEHAAGNVDRASADLPQITGPFRQIAPETAENVRQISIRLRNASEKVGNIAEQFGTQTQLFHEVHVTPMAKFTLLPNSVPNVRTEGDIDLRARSAFLRLGLVGISPNTFVNAQVGNKVNDQFWVRYGVVQSHLGIGVDYWPQPGLLLSGDLFNPNRLHGNITLGYQLKSFGNPWWVDAGWYNVLNHQTFGVGVTYRP